MKKWNFEKVYLVGIGGVSMSALAKYYLSQGLIVSGSDLVSSERTRELERLGVTIFTRHERENVVGADRIVVTSAVQDNEEISYAREKGIPIFSRTDAWREIMELFYHTVGVAGSHGKTTCTAMLSHIFYAGGESFSAHIGGDDLAFGNFISRGSVTLITESCEYKRNLLSMIPETAVLLNMDRDHMECYRNEDDLKDTFFRFCTLAKRAIVQEGILIPDAVTFGIGKGDYSAVRIRQRGEKYAFTVEEYGKPLVRIRLKVFGLHNVLNALAAVATARQFGILPCYIKKGLEEFTGVKRRFEKIGTYRGAEIIADYAHHPREISAVLRVFAKRNRKLLVLFQPHTYSRTRLLFSDFVDSLEGYDPIIYKTFPAREEYDERGSAKRLSLAIKNSRYADSERELKNILEREVKGKMTVLVLGAGDLYEIIMGLPCET